MDRKFGIIIHSALNFQRYFFCVYRETGKKRVVRRREEEKETWREELKRKRKRPHIRIRNWLIPYKFPENFFWFQHFSLQLRQKQKLPIWVRAFTFSKWCDTERKFFVNSFLPARNFYRIYGILSVSFIIPLTARDFSFFIRCFITCLSSTCRKLYYTAKINTNGTVLKYTLDELLSPKSDLYIDLSNETTFLSTRLENSFPKFIALVSSLLLNLDSVLQEV